MSTVFVANIFATRWLFTRDRSFLLNSFGTTVTVYRFLSEVVDFWLCYLEEDAATGFVRDVNDCVGELCSGSPPNEVNKDPMLTLALLRYSANALLEASIALGKDASKRPQWRRLLCKLAPFPTIVDTHNVSRLLFVDRDNSTSLEAATSVFPGGVVVGDLQCSTQANFNLSQTYAIAKATIEEIGPSFFATYSCKSFSAALLARVNKTMLYEAMASALRPCTIADDAGGSDMNGALCVHPSGYVDNHKYIALCCLCVTLCIYCACYAMLCPC